MPPKKAKGSSTKKASSSSKAKDDTAPAPPRATRSTRASKKAEIVEEEAPVTDTPDIAGVVEEREDEDIAIDASEPRPNDELEKQRQAERPAEARDTAEEAPGATMMQVDETIPTQQEDGIAAQLDPFALNSVQIGDDNDKAEGSSSSSVALTKEERMDKLNALRKRMTDSASANRREVVAAQNEHRKTISESKRLERKRRQAEAMGEKLDALETGEDLERKRNWEYSLEDNERWNKKQATKDRRMDKGFASYDDSARRKYKKDVDALKPDLNGYKAQRNAALGLIDTDEASTSTSTDLIHGSTSSSQLVPGADQLYRDASSFVYADHKPSDEAIDRVISQINTDIDKRAKRSRVRDEKDEDVTYINDRNKVFNRKLERYYNSYTKDISDNFERGTAL